MTQLKDLCLAAKNACPSLALAGTQTKNHLLEAIAKALLDNQDTIISENQKDLAVAKQNGLSAAMQERLTLTPQRIEGIADSLHQVCELPDPIGTKLGEHKHENGMQITKRRVPIGLIGIIYESRPNVTVDAAALCIKSGNCVVLRGGKEAISSNLALVKIMRECLEAYGLDPNCVCLVENTDRESATQLMRMSGVLDLLIPRGSAGLIKTVVENATVPVIETGAGNCHTFVDQSADLEMAANIAFNAKCSRPSVCNAMETLLVHRAVAAEFLPKVKKLLDTKNVELRGCPETVKILGSSVLPATDEDYFQEFNDYILAVKVVSDLNAAMEHISKHTTFHSECIVTGDFENANTFCDRIDAAAVYVNASTRFTDGGEFGLGAEIGISTQKIHARGPMGLEQLTTVKYVVFGSGQTR